MFWVFPWIFLYIYSYSMFSRLKPVWHSTVDPWITYEIDNSAKSSSFFALSSPFHPVNPFFVYCTVQCFGSGSASASNKNQDPDPHQINIRNRIRIRLRVKVISRIRIRFRIRIRIEVMRIRNTIQWSTVQFSCLNLECVRS